LIAGNLHVSSIESSVSPWPETKVSKFYPFGKISPLFLPIISTISPPPGRVANVCDISILLDLV